MLRLADAGLEHLIPVELCILCEQAAPERGHEGGPRSALLEISVRFVAGFVDHALHVEAIHERVETSGPGVR